ncbi:hypothetical protein PSPHG_CDS_0181 [Pseudomonas phage Psxphi15]
MHYNEKLADQQGLTTEEREALDLTYDLLHDVLEYPERYENVEDTVRELEYRLQKEWKFPQDPKFHRYQLEIKGCTCPRMDNFELFGHTADRYRVSDCPWHWKEEV